jgi:2-keto-myo-inositol isomerase
MGTFQLCFNTSTIRPTAIQDKIKIAGKAGYDSVELWSDDLTGFERSGGRLAEIRNMLEDAGLLVPDVVHLSGWMEADEASYKGDVLAEKDGAGSRGGGTPDYRGAGTRRH